MPKDIFDNSLDQSPKVNNGSGNSNSFEKKSLLKQVCCY